MSTPRRPKNKNNTTRYVKRWTVKAHNGDSNAMTKIIAALRQMESKIFALGYRLNAAGVLVERTPEWDKEQELIQFLWGKHVES